MNRNALSWSMCWPKSGIHALLMLFCGMALHSTAFAQSTFVHDYVGSNCRAVAVVAADSSNLWMMRTDMPYGDPYHFNTFLTKVDAAGVPLVNYALASSPTDQLWGFDAAADAVSQAVTVVGSTRGDSLHPGVQSGFCLQMDGSGTVQFAQRLTNDSMFINFTRVAPSAPQSVVAVGLAADVDFTRGVVARYSNVDGHLMQQTAWSGLLSARFEDVVQVPNTDVIVAVGDTRAFGASSGVAYVLAVDTNGNKLWSRTIDGPSDDRAYAVLADGNSVLVFGRTNGNLSTCKGFVARVSLTGDLLDFQELQLSNLSFIPMRAVRVPSTGAILLTGICDPVGGGDPFLMQLDSNLTPVWGLTFTGIYFYTVPLLSVAAPSATAPLYFTALRLHGLGGGGGADAVLHSAQLDGSGDWTCGHVVQTVSASPLAVAWDSVVGDQVLLNLHDQAFVVPTSQEPLVYLDSCGGYVPVGVAPSVVPSVSFGPNPVVRELRVLLEGMVDGCTLVLRDVAGRVMLEREVFGGADVVLDLGNLPVGIYLLSVEGRGVRWTQKVVKVAL
jgi:hypothetical protein